MIGQTLSHFKITAKLGEGGMGEVYRAEDTHLGREVAIKVLPAAVAADSDWLERFDREARAASALNHPHICTIHELGEHEGQPFLVMELMQGRTLKDRLEAQPIASDRVIEIGLQVADALAAAHDKGIVHRDLKPANLFVTERGDIKILDFGLAKLSSDVLQVDSQMPTEQTSRNLTEVGSTLGTVSYMSPEQARGEALGPASDLFSLGIVLYEMAAGQQPFNGPTSAVVFSEILAKDPVSLRQVEAAVPAGLESVVSRLLEKDPALRYQSAADLYSDLRRLRRDSGTESTVTSTARSTGARAAARRFGKIALVSLLVILAGMAVWRWRSTPDGVSQTPASIEPVASSNPTARSIAVLPFQNLGADTSVDYLRLAVPDEITTALSRVPELTVRPFAAATALLERPTDLQATGRELRADNVVTGQYYTEGDRLNLSLETVSVEDNRVVWRGRISVPAKDLLDLRQQVADQVRAELLPELGIQTSTAFAEQTPENAEAYELYIRSLGVSDRSQPNKQAIEMLEKSIELDPSFAPAYMALSLRYHNDSWYSDGGVEALKRSDAVAKEAVQLDPSLIGPQLHLVIQGVEAGDLEGSYRRAIELISNRPDSAFSWFARSYVFRYAGLLEEGAADCLKALSLDPVNTRIRSCALLFALKQDPERSTDFLNLDFGTDWFFDAQANVLASQGDIEGAAASFQSLSQSAVFPFEGQIFAHCHEKSPEALAAVDKAIEMSVKTTDSEPMYWAGAGLSICGHGDEALILLRMAIKRGYCSYPAIDHDPQWDPVRTEPEFLEIRAEGIACHQGFREFVDNIG